MIYEGVDGVEESIVNAPPDYNFDQLFKSNLAFCVFLICSLKNQSISQRVVHSQSTLQRQLRRRRCLQSSTVK
jgi:hypothetical protein